MRFRVSGSLAVVAALAFVPAVHGQLLLDDPLAGSTTGTRAGGTFVAGGWRVDNQYDSIFWHIPLVSHGAFEYQVRGLPPGQNCPGTASNSKNEISHMYDYTFNNADFQYSPGYQSTPYKQFIRKQCESGKTDTLELLWQILPNYLEDDSQVLSWDVNTTYTFRDEWENTGGNGILRTYRNGALIRTQTLPGGWNPGGFSVRIAASTRRADEGAAVGAVYSNVKVYDLSCGTPPTPAITSPAVNETVNTSIAFVQWSGTAAEYQVRVNTGDNPEAGIVWDSQPVTPGAGANRNFTWTGTLNNAMYHAFVRVGNCGIWSPWSAGRPFTINTAHVPPGPNVVRVRGNSLCDNNGPMLALGATYMRAMYNCRNLRASHFTPDCAFLASKGIKYIRILTMVGWQGLEIAPVSFTNSGGSVPAWPDYWQQFRDCIDIAYTHGLRTEVTIFADAQTVMPSKSARISHMQTVLNNLVGREHKIMHLEVANEAWQNGFSGSQGIADLREFCQYLTDRTTIPVGISAPADDSISGVHEMYGGSTADLVMLHLSRNISTNEGGWLPVRDAYRTGLEDLPPISSNEPIGPGSSVNTENDPIKLCAAGFFAWTAGLPAYVFHSRAGVFGWTGCCPPGGTEVRFSTTPGVDSYQNLFSILPPDLPSWERNDGKASAAPFTSFANGQADRWWTEVASPTSGCVRNISAIKGGEFVACPIGILAGGLELEARAPMTFQVYHPITGAVAYSLTKNTGERFTLAQGPQTYIIKGVFTDLANPSTDVCVDLGSPDVVSGVTHLQVGDGDTTPVTIGGRDARQNVNPAQDFYFYFNVSDAYAYQGSKSEVYVTIEYYDTGTSPLSLQYDAIGADFALFYKNAGGVARTNTNTWKRYVWHLTDAWFGNRQNAGADFRIAGAVGATFQLDTVCVSTQPPLPPVIAPVTPNPELMYPGTPYVRQLTLTQGHPAPTWSLLTGPPGLTVNAFGFVSGWTPAPGELGDHPVQVQATNSEGVDTHDWVLRVLSGVDFDMDGDVDIADFGFLQRCFSGDAFLYPAGCEDADLDGELDVDGTDLNLFLPCMQGPNQNPGC